MSRRGGFTLVEMLIAVGLMAIVAGELVAVMVGVFRMEKNRLWNAEFADRLRVARENILFRAVAPSGGRRYGGLLSATNIVRYGEQVAANFAYAEDQKSAAFDEVARSLAERFSITGMDDGSQEITDAYVTNGLMFIEVKVTIRMPGVSGGVSNRIERIAVPVMDGVDLGEGHFLWADFIDISREGGYAKWIYP